MSSVGNLQVSVGKLQLPAPPFFSNQRRRCIHKTHTAHYNKSFFTVLFKEFYVDLTI